ncbi:MAG: DNA repair protein RecN [candidate division Zixibacteria bacterium]|nr:DNA repair protein RecN [candidate division Zixibacteria bacterium]
MILKRLTIRNFALINEAIIDFEAGLTVLTGETGAGKSVVVGALALALGGRGDKEFIRHGCDSANVRAVFDNPSDAKEIEISRQVSRKGASKVRVDGQPSSAKQLRELTAPTVQIVSQHAGQLLTDEENHLDFLDHLAGTSELCEEVADLYASWQHSAVELRRVSNRRQQLINERELLLFQKGEIEQACLRSGEEEELITERRRLDSTQSLMASASQIVGNLSGDADHSGVVDMVGAVRKELENMAEDDPTLSKQVEAVAEIDFQVEELRRSIEQYGGTLHDDPVRLEEVNLRLDEIYKLKKKYGGSEEAVLVTLEDITAHLKDRPDIDGLLDTLTAETDKRRQTYAGKAVALHRARKKATKDIGRNVVKELSGLAIDGARFECELVSDDDDDGIFVNGRALKPSSYGLETARFLFSANPGEPMRSLVKTASGGEMSRVLLALKLIERGRAGLKENLLVFDEVDVGIGGRTAIEVGRKLKTLSESCQVVVITHLHQIARLADHHFLATKIGESTSDISEKSGIRTTITIRKLDAVNIDSELARMVALPEEEVQP